MKVTGLTIREAAEMWVKEFNAIDQRMISRLMEEDPCDWREVTKPSYGDRVYVYEPPCDENCGTVEEYLEETDSYLIKLDDENTVECHAGDFEVEYDDSLPMWGTMWSFGDSCDDWWLEEDDGIRKMSWCGFRIYESEEFGYFFGIDGCGYDFYSEHWLPLYKARGLQWHDPETEKDGK